MDQKKIIEALSFWIGNTVVLLVSAQFFGGNVVLGNDKISAPMAAVVSGLIVTVLGYAVPPLVEKSGVKVKGDNLWGAVFFAANVLIVWVIKRFALLLGLGISSIIYVLIVAVLLTAGQWAVAWATGAMGKSKKRK